MERMHLTGATMDQCVQRSVEVIKDGGVILYPTDTLYGLGADAFSDEAVDKVIQIKSRAPRKPIHCVVSDMAMAARYAEVSDDARLLAKAFFPGALTIVLKKRPEFGHGIGRHRDTIGIRIPDNAFCLALASALDAPFTTTSANTSRQPDVFSIDKILEQLYDHAKKIDIVIDAGERLPRLASTVVDLFGESPIILRERAIPAADIWNTIRAEA